MRWGSELKSCLVLITILATGQREFISSDYLPNTSISWRRRKAMADLLPARLEIPSLKDLLGMVGCDLVLTQYIDVTPERILLFCRGHRGPAMDPHRSRKGSKFI